MALERCHNAAMNIDPYVESIRNHMAVTAEGSGDEGRALAERLVAQLEAPIRLAIQDALSAAAQELTVELAPGSVELRLRGREPELVVTLPPTDEPATEDVAPDQLPAGDGEVARINLRLPDQLKSRVEESAAREGLSVNAWLVRAAAAAVERRDPSRRREGRNPHGAQRYTGWAR